MTSQEIEIITQVIEQEGFDYAFHNYSDFKDDIKDKKFHKLRKAFLDARKALANYIEHDDEMN